MARLHQRLRHPGLVVAAMVTALATTPATAKSQYRVGSNNTTQIAYQTAIQCFVANGSAREDRRTAGDPAGAARYDEKSRQSFDMAVRLGRTLNYSNERINGDLGTIMDRELPLMVSNAAHFRQVVANCRAYGLM